MMFVTRSIDKTRTPLIVGGFQEDTLTCRMPKGEILRIPRELVETPVLCCDQCGLPVIVKLDKKTRKDYAECPDNARHMYDDYYTASHDTTKFNHNQRRKLRKEAQKWLLRWTRIFEGRNHVKVSTALDVA